MTEDRAQQPQRPDAPRAATPVMPVYKGEPLDAERGPGLGCFWLQVGILAILLILTPLTVVWAFPPWISAALLIVTLVVVLFAGQTVIFLLRLVAADRRTRRRPLAPGARATVGMLEESAETGGGAEVRAEDGAPVRAENGPEARPEDAPASASAGQDTGAAATIDPRP